MCQRQGCGYYDRGTDGKHDRPEIEERPGIQSTSRVGFADGEMFNAGEKKKKATAGVDAGRKMLESRRRRKRMNRQVWSGLARSDQVELG